MLTVTRITLTALFMQAYAGPAMPAQNAPALRQPALSRRGAFAAASSMLLPLPAFAYQGTSKGYGPKKGYGSGGAKKIEFDKNGDRVPGADSITEAEEPVPTSGRFGLEPKQAPPKPQFYGPKRGTAKRRAPTSPAEEMFSETESHFMYLPTAAFIGFLVGSGVTFVVFRRRLVLSTTAAEPFLSLTA